jgi:hypothetical protein
MKTSLFLLTSSMREELALKNLRLADPIVICASAYPEFNSGGTRLPVLRDRC